MSDPIAFVTKMPDWVACIQYKAGLMLEEEQLDLDTVYPEIIYLLLENFACSLRSLNFVFEVQPPSSVLNFLVVELVLGAG